MQLRLILYVSESTAPLSRPELLALNYASQTNNQRAGITGLMVYSSGNIIQAIEGDPNRIRDLFDRIRRDARHMNIRTLLDEFTTERTFEGWAMGLLDLSRLRRLDLDRLSMALRAAAKAQEESEKRRCGRIVLGVFRDFVQQAAA